MIYVKLCERKIKRIKKKLARISKRKIKLENKLDNTKIKKNTYKTLLDVNNLGKEKRNENR